MQVISLAQVYNEEFFAERALSWIYPVVDRIVISEGRLTPFGSMSARSTDKTREVLGAWKAAHDTKNKISIVDAFEGGANDREGCEGRNKNNLLNLAEPENGDIIVVHDFDEFWDQDRFSHIIDLFRGNNKIKNVPVEEWQFAYNLHLAFKASHSGRFFRYVKGARFGNTNHFYYPDTHEDISKDYGFLQPREVTGMCHLCWTKHPNLIREKVISFQRPSFTTWFNNVYLIWPFNQASAYWLNSRIPPYHGRGFCEGQHELLQTYTGPIPTALANLNVNYLDYIKHYARSLSVPGEQYRLV